MENDHEHSALLSHVDNSILCFRRSDRIEFLLVHNENSADFLRVHEGSHCFVVWVLAVAFMVIHCSPLSVGVSCSGTDLDVRGLWPVFLRCSVEVSRCPAAVPRSVGISYRRDEKPPIFGPSILERFNWTFVLPKIQIKAI